MLAYIAGGNAQLIYSMDGDLILSMKITDVLDLSHGNSTPGNSSYRKIDIPSYNIAFSLQYLL